MAGPMKRKDLYRYLLKSMYENGYFDEWRQTNEVCDRVNRDVPDRWTQMSPSSVFRYVRKLPVEERHMWQKTQMIRQWKRI